MAVPPLPETPAASPVPTKDERTWGMLCHLAALAGFIVPFGGIIGPLVVWLVKKDEYPFVNEQGKESLNFQITMAIIFLVCVPLILIVVGFLLIMAAGIFDLVMVIIATVRANEGKPYRYPFRLQLIK